MLFFLNDPQKQQQYKNKKNHCDFTMSAKSKFKLK